MSLENSTPPPTLFFNWTPVIYGEYKKGKYVSDLFNPQGRVCVISSAMGTGKTKFIMDNIWESYADFKHILIVSTRNTYKYKMNASRLMFGSVNKIQIVQVDSLKNIEWGNPKDYFVIMDEFEAILQRMGMLNDLHIFIIVCNMIRFARKVFLADAIFTKETKHYLQKLTHYNIYINKFQPYAGNICTFFGLPEIKSVVQALVKDKKKFVGPVRSIKNCKMIRKLVHQEAPDYKVCVICSEDNSNAPDYFVKYGQEEGLKIPWDLYDVVLYTETITVGIDFQDTHFDSFLAIYEPPMSPDLFVQSLFRSRNFKSSRHYIFLSTGGGEDFSSSPEKFAKSLTFFDDSIGFYPDYMVLYDLCKERTKKIYSSPTQYIRMCLRNLGFRVEESQKTSTPIDNSPCSPKDKKKQK